MTLLSAQVGQHGTLLRIPPTVVSKSSGHGSVFREKDARSLGWQSAAYLQSCFWHLQCNSQVPLWNLHVKPIFQPRRKFKNPTSWLVLRGNVKKTGYMLCQWQQREPGLELGEYFWLTVKLLKNFQGTKTNRKFRLNSSESFGWKKYMI